LPFTNGLLQYKQALCQQYTTGTTFLRGAWMLRSIREMAHQQNISGDELGSEQKTAQSSRLILLGRTISIRQCNLNIILCFMLLMLRPRPLLPLAVHFLPISIIWTLAIQDLSIQADPFTDRVNKYKDIPGNKIKIHKPIA
jgi:hypothetical protein